MGALREFPGELEVEAGPRRDSWRLYIHGPDLAGVVVASRESDVLGFAEVYAQMRREQIAATPPDAADGPAPGAAAVKPRRAATPESPAPAGADAALRGAPGGEW